jgi:hypothetical protein
MIGWRAQLACCFMLTVFNTEALAQNCANPPNQLTNGTTADATKVMGDFDYFGTCAASTASPNFTGSVGVGTATPAATLDVRGNVNLTSGVSLGNTNVGSSSGSSPLYSAIGAQPLPSGSPGGGFGLISGPNIVSPVIWMYAYSGLNAFQVRSVGYVGSVTTAPTLFDVDANGNVGSGTTNPTYLLYVNGSGYATGSFVNGSDIRLKRDVRTLPDGALNLVAKFRPVVFRWKEPKDDGMKGDQLGFIAQEVEKVAPSIVLTQRDRRKTKGLKYDEFIPLLVKAVQEQQSEIAALKARETRTGWNAGNKYAHSEQAFEALRQDNMLLSTKLKQDEERLAKLQARLDAMSEDTSHAVHTRTAKRVEENANGLAHD